MNVPTFSVDIRPLPVPASLLGESPFWRADEEALYWCDIAGRALHRHDFRTASHRRWSVEAEPSCCAPLQEGGLVVAMRDGLWRFDTATGERQRLCEPPYDPTTERFNDGKADPQGRFWVGTIYEPRRPPLASLHRYAGGRLERVADGITNSNGLAWSPDGGTMYWTDTAAHAVTAFDFDRGNGSLSRRRLFAEFPKRGDDEPLELYGGRPDGAAVDAEGAYWVSMYEGARLLRLAPNGDMLAEIRLPVRCPTMPCFGGRDLRTLYVTTVREKRPAEELAREPWAGCVLEMRVDVPGLPVNFARIED